jgi:hypothetical protein
MVVSRKSLEILQGEPGGYSATLADGRVKQGKLCARCGTRLWGEPVKNPALVVIQPGTLDDTSWLRPVAHIWTRSAQPWVVFPPEAVRFEREPEDPKALAALWRQTHAG